MKKDSISTDIDIARQIAQNNELMALPEAVIKVLETIARDEVGLDKLSDIIGNDPALCGRLLKIANSSFYGLNHKINNIHQAVMVLGITTVKCLALSAALFNHKEIARVIGVSISTIYGNIISVAVTSRKLAVAVKYPAPEDAFTCGLLHNIGLLYLLHHYPDEYHGVLEKLKQSGSLSEEEKKQFGLTHAEIGRMIAQKWRLPQDIISAISNHHTCNGRDSRLLDDIVRLAVALNRDIFLPSEQYVEDKIAKIGLIASRLNLGHPQLDDIAASIARDATAFAGSIDVPIEDNETILAKANQEIFSTYLSVQKLFKERQELTKKILDEERERGLLEAKQIAISTLSHYINNAIMAISGNSQVVRMTLKSKKPEEVVQMLPRILDTVDDAVRKISAVLEEISEINSLVDIEYYSQSRIMNIDARIKDRMAKIEKSSGLVLPVEAQVHPDFPD
jgi:HD-like signal output (HDOD) protein